MTPDDLKEARLRAETWLIADHGRTRPTRDTAINEEHLALDVLELVDEVGRLQRENAEHTSDIINIDRACRGPIHVESGGYDDRCKCGRWRRR